MRPVLFAFSLLRLADALAQTCFPGPDLSASSPDGRYSVHWSEPEPGSDTHELQIMERSPLNLKSYLTSFIRSACVVWAPHSTYIAVTLNDASTDAETWIYPVPSLREKILVRSILPEKVIHPVAAYGHLYIRATAWDDQGLHIAITGHNDETPNEETNQNVICRPNPPGFSCDG